MDTKIVISYANTQTVYDIVGKLLNYKKTQICHFRTFVFYNDIDTAKKDLIDAANMLEDEGNKVHLHVNDDEVKLVYNGVTAKLKLEEEWI